MSAAVAPGVAGAARAADEPPLKVLLAVRPYRGHLHSIVPMAKALQAAGHEVLVATAPELAPTVFSAGLDWLPAGLDAHTVYELIEPRPGVAADDPDFGEYAIGSKVGDLVGTMLGPYRPDLVVREATDVAAAVAGEVIGLPVVTYGITSFIDRESFLGEGVAANLERIRAAFGLDPDPLLASMYRGLYLAVVPPEFDEDPLPVDEVQRVAYRAWDGGAGERGTDGDAVGRPASAAAGGRPQVLVTLGTVFNERFDLLRAWCAALAGDGWSVICTLGADLDPAEFGEPPAHVRLERYVPHSSLLPGCALVVCHGGLNTVMGALCEGVPVVAVPLGSDQEHNARRVAELGLGLELAEEGATAAAVATAARRIRDDDAFASRACAFARRVAALPGLDEGVRSLERVARSPAAAAPVWARYDEGGSIRPGRAGATRRPHLDEHIVPTPGQLDGAGA